MKSSATDLLRAFTEARHVPTPGWRTGAGWRRCRAAAVRLALAIGIALPPAGAKAASLVSQFESARGPVSHLEEPNGRAYLNLERSGKRVPFPATWRNTNVEHAMDLGTQTAVVVSYSEPGCEARLALLVVTPAVVWGPYQLGECNDMLAYQRSEDRSSFVAIRADGSRPLAWVYSTLDQNFRGPAKVELPSSLAALTAARPAPRAPAPTRTPAPSPAAPPAPAARPPKPANPPPTAAVVPVFSPKDAGTVAEEMRRTTRSQRRVNIDLT